MNPEIQPLISVIVPTFQRSNLLSRTLNSIYAQTWNNIEVIVVEDNIPGSDWEKETSRVIKTYIKNKNLIHLKTSGQIGGGEARNLAIHQCSGEYVAFLDDDDCYLPDKIERQVSFMIENKLDGSYHDVEWRDAKGRLVECRQMNYTTDYSTTGLLKAHILHSIAPTGVYMFRRDKLITTDGFGDVPSGQDFILMLRCIEKKMKISYMQGVYVVQHIHKGKRISVGDTKLRGENMLYELKHKYFYLLTDKEKAYVKFRHYAVLSFASMRNGRFDQAIKYAVRTIYSSPGDCINETIRYFGSKFRRK